MLVLWYRQYKGSVVCLCVLSAILDPKQAWGLETESQSELCSTQSVKACVLIRWHEMSVVNQTIALCLFPLRLIYLVDLMTSRTMSLNKKLLNEWSLDFLNQFTTIDSDHVQVELCGRVTYLIKLICIWFNHCSLIGCVSGMPGSGCSRWAVHSFQESRGGVIGRWPYLGGAVGGIILHWHVLQGPSHLTDALPLVLYLSYF